MLKKRDSEEQKDKENNWLVPGLICHQPAEKSDWLKTKNVSPIIKISFCTEEHWGSNYILKSYL